MKLINIRKVYHNKKDDVEALKGITLDLNHNGIIMLLGPSGCGKTTLLEIISGRESYEGELLDVPHFDYLTQDFHLFEEMSVWENLFLVSQDKEMIHHYLKEFQLEEHKNKKVKKLSNGQKKRVQFIRALLHQPGLLLCDEPTAALDHENVILLMEELKKISEDVQILFVTHDIALAEKYADRIIRMEQGVVISDEMIHEHEKSQKGKEIHHKSEKETLWLSLHNLHSRMADTLGTIILFTLCIFSVFVMCNFYLNVKSQDDYMSAFKNAKNLIVSVPDREIKNTGETYSGYTKKYLLSEFNQLYQYKDIQKVIEENPEIMAVESYYSYKYEIDSGLEYILWKTDSNVFERLVISAGNSSAITLGNNPRETPYIITDEEQLWDFDEYLNFPSYEIQVFDLVNDHEELPLMYGSYPKEENEVLLSRNVADMLMEMEGYKSYEEMIGQIMKLGLQGRKNGYTSMPEDIGYDALPFADLLEVKISGISSVENDYMNMVFFNNGYGNNPVLRHFVVDDSELYFYYVRFLLEPGSDYEAVAEKIDRSLHKDSASITIFQGKGLGNDVVFYRSPSSFMIYGAVILILLLGILFVFYLFKRKRMRKESEIMRTYGYSSVSESLMRNGCLLMISFLLVVMLGNQACEKINAIAEENFYQPFLTMDIGMLLMALVSVGVIVGILECLMFKRKMR